MLDNVGAFYILNNVILPSKKLDNINIPENNVVYEVIRVIDGVPLFLEDHYIRMRNSLSLLDRDLKISQQEMDSRIRKLIRENSLLNCNVKILVYHEDNIQSGLMYINRSYYPANEEVLKGVKLSLVEWERENPNAKLVNTNYKETVGRKIQETGSFEVLLVNSKKEITEGSRSNAFFVKGTKVFTAPGEYVLKGITRQYIIDVCKNLGLHVVESPVSLESLEELEGVFISGTSIKVLPVSNIDSHIYKSGEHPTISAIRHGFDRLLDEYINEHRGL